MEKEPYEQKLFEFYKLYKKLRKLVPDTPIHELIEILLKETGYGDYAAAMPAGERRYANLRMLVEKAIAYEKTSYKGLFHFVRYIDELQKYDVDFGEADLTNENEDVVRIMSIHKSKGLEFPVVFVSGLGKILTGRIREAAWCCIRIMVWDLILWMAADVSNRRRLQRKQSPRKLIWKIWVKSCGYFM